MSGSNGSVRNSVTANVLFLSNILGVKLQLDLSTLYSNPITFDFWLVYTSLHCRWPCLPLPHSHLSSRTGLTAVPQMFFVIPFTLPWMQFIQKCGWLDPTFHSDFCSDIIEEWWFGLLYTKQHFSLFCLAHYVFHHSTTACHFSCIYNWCSVIYLFDWKGVLFSIRENCLSTRNNFWCILCCSIIAKKYEWINDLCWWSITCHIERFFSLLADGLPELTTANTRQYCKYYFTWVTLNVPDLNLIIFSSILVCVLCGVG